MDFNLSPEEEAFRDDVRTWLEENLPAPEERDPGFILEWWKKVREKRWIGFNWPKEVTGGGGSLIEQFLLKQELIRANAPLLGKDVSALQWVGPAIIQFGSEEQKQKFIPEVLDNQSAWCTGYSEPGVGSDLASLRCGAVREGDHYIVNGQKTWTSLAAQAKWIYNMVRTEVTGSKHDGITCLLIPMDTPGIEIRPIRAMSMGGMVEMLNDVFFTDVRVPVENRLGEEGQGWEIICSALQHERSGISEVNRHETTLDALYELARRTRRRGKPAFEERSVRRKLAEFEAKIESVKLNGLRTLSHQIQGVKGKDSVASINKLHNCDLLVEMSDFAVELLGNAGPLLGESDAAVDNGRWALSALAWPATVIGGGTPNIQKNIIAERFLGLPKD